jgi:endonuclease/exonuclease/phosphatase family metal-dependent hydrolase
MPNYLTLEESAFTLNRNYVIDKLLGLKTALQQQIPKKAVDSNFLLATWNIREFERGSFGPRLPETYLYIAEIVSSFDLVAIQEVREDLTALHKLMQLLGPHWNYLVTDITEGSAGNGERMAFVYDSRKVTFSNLAGEIVLPPKRLPKINPADKKEETRYEQPTQFARTPYIVSFASGWFKFNLCTVHMYFGEATNLTRRLKEIEDLAMFFKNRIIRENKSLPDDDYWDYINYILLGDFNIISRTDKTFLALTKDTGFKLPEGIEKNVLTGTNVSKDKFYDQIVLNEKEGNACIVKAGIFDYYEHVYQLSEFEHYKKDMNEVLKNSTSKTKEATEAYYKKWRTYQMSDHLPMWVEFDIDFSKRYLNDKKDKVI